MRIEDVRSPTWAAGFCSPATASLTREVPAAMAPAAVMTSRGEGMVFSSSSEAAQTATLRSSSPALRLLGADRLLVRSVTLLAEHLVLAPNDLNEGTVQGRAGLYR